MTGPSPERRRATALTSASRLAPAGVRQGEHGPPRRRASGRRLEQPKNGPIRRQVLTGGLAHRGAPGTEKHATRSGVNRSSLLLTSAASRPARTRSAGISEKPRRFRRRLLDSHPSFQAIGHPFPGIDPARFLAWIEAGARPAGHVPTTRLGLADEGHAEQRSRADERSAYEGTGIGLSIARKIAWRHEGDITATSVEGEGATFRLTLPLAKTAPGELDAAA